MIRTFASEDNRKTKLFEEWIKYLTEIHSNLMREEFDEIFEGMASVSYRSKNRIGFHLEDGRKIQHVPITPGIAAYTCGLDQVYVVLGLQDKRWRPLDIISVGSIIDHKKGGAHITFNPLYMPQGPNQRH